MPQRIITTAQKSQGDGSRHRKALQSLDLDSGSKLPRNLIPDEPTHHVEEEEKREAEGPAALMKNNSIGPVRKLTVPSNGSKESPEKRNIVSELSNVPLSSTVSVQQYEAKEPVNPRESNIFVADSQVQGMKLPKANKSLPKENRPMELIIQPFDGVQTNNFYCLNEEGGRIGRHSNNEIVVLEESVSRFHSKIEFKEGRFYIADIGSTTGTFIKIQAKLELQEGQILELGSNQFLVEEINCIDREEGELKLRIIEGLHADQEFCIVNSATIGRKANNQSGISFADDLHLSNTHAKIEYIEGKFVLEDLGSTNG